MLAAILCAETWPASQVRRPVRPPAMAVILQPPARPRRPAGALASAILARPLFMPTRRPPATAKTIAGSAGALPRLSGIVVSGAYRRAIFERSGKQTILAVGDRVDADRVVAITADAVTLGDGKRDRTIRPGFDPARPVTPYVPSSGSSILDRLNLHQTPPAALPKPPSLQELMRRLPPS